MSYFDLAINLVEAAIICNFLRKYLVMKNGFRSIYLPFFIFFLASMTTLVNLTVEYEGFLVLLFIVPILLFTLIFSKQTIVESIFVSFFVYLIISVVNASLVITMSMLIYQEVNVSLLLDSTISELVIIVSKVMLYLVFEYIVKVRRDYKEKLNDYEALILLISTILLICTLMPFEYEMYSGYIDSFSFLVGIIALTTLSILFVFSYFNSIKMAKKIKEEEMKVVIQSNEIKNFLLVKEINDEIKILRHDMKHLLKYLHTCMENEEKEKGLAEIKEYLTKIDSTRNVVLCGNPIVNFAISQLKSNCEKRGLNFHCSINSNCQFSLSNNDLIIVLSNIFENAAKYCDGKKEISLIIKKVDSFQLIIIENSIREESVNIDNSLINRKDEQHGYGITSAKNTIYKYNGKITLKSENYKVQCKIVIHE